MRVIRRWLSKKLILGDAVIPKKGKAPGLKIFIRNHFSSALKRMSVIAGYTVPGTSETTYIATIKGAPETLKTMVFSVLFSITGKKFNMFSICLKAF